MRKDPNRQPDDADALGFAQYLVDADPTLVFRLFEMLESVEADLANPDGEK